MADHINPEPELEQYPNAAHVYVTPALTSAPPHLTSASASIATPVNFILLTLFVLLVYMRLRPAPPPTLPKPAQPIVFRTYTPRTLAPFDGTGKSPIYIAVRGNVYDVSPGRQFYGPGGPYANFAGRDASRGLACQSFDEDMLTKDLDGPLDGLVDLGSEELEALAGWEETFRGKYLRVGKLVSLQELEEAERKEAEAEAEAKRTAVET
ncbi:MAG: hypothetical protein M1832_003373 [Thelocarpon impressellum]|nr:MAG: hypothetical protein M1832_003373 [Thelocarpon impressellum]